MIRLICRSLLHILMQLDAINKHLGITHGPTMAGRYQDNRDDLERAYLRRPHKWEA